MGHAGEGVEIIRDAGDIEIIRMLQLGHAGEGVEICGVSAAAWWLAQLQLGHAGEGVEIAFYGCFFLIMSSFNWATPVKAWRLPYLSACVNTRLASIGPRR